MASMQWCAVLGSQLSYIPCLYVSFKFLSPEELNDASWSCCGNLLAIRRAFCNRMRISRKLSHKPTKKIKIVL